MTDVTVTQAAREAAKALWRPFGEESGYFFNCRDDGLMVQAFARFEHDIRLATEAEKAAAVAEAVERCAKVAENFAKPNGWEDFSDGQGCASEAIATAIHNLSNGGGE